MRAVILSIGSELILGQLTDTNSTFLAQELAANGIELIGVRQVGDDRPRLVEALQRGLHDADCVICTGGIGPTDDDLTREAIAEVVGEQPVVDSHLLAALRAHFAQRGIDMPARNAKQAWTIPSAEILPNPIGTAPGWFVTAGNEYIVTMPGVPREMMRMWREQALPRMRRLAGGYVIDTTTLKTIGIGESNAEQEIHDLVEQPNPVVATYAKDDGVHIRVTGMAPNPVTAHDLRERAVETIRSRLGRYIWGVDQQELPDVLVHEIQLAGQTLAIAEAGSGGRLAALLNGSPAAPEAISGTLVFGNGDGAAADLARQAVHQFHATLGLGIILRVHASDTGVFTGDADVALIAGQEPHLTPLFAVRGALPEAQRRAALHAADVLRVHLATLGRR